MDENVVLQSMGSKPSLQNEPISKTRTGLDQQLGQRSPLKNILNTSPPQPRVTKTADTLSRFEAVRQLDEEAEWRERAEVVTALDHRNNMAMARDLVDQTIVAVTNRAQTRTAMGPVAFREAKNITLVDSESEYESAEEDEEETILAPQEKVTVSPKSPTSPLTWASSTLLHPASAVSTPHRSESFENSLLNSFENMKIVEKDDEKFHDASDDFSNHQGDSCREFGSTNSPIKEHTPPIDLPNKENVQPINSPIKENVQHINTVSMENVTPINCPSKETVKSKKSHSKENKKTINSHSNGSMQLTNPSNKEKQPIKSPSKESVQNNASLTKKSVQFTTSSKDIVQPTSSPYKESLQSTTSPSKESAHSATSSSKETVNTINSLSKDILPPSTSPSKESLESTNCIDHPQPVVVPPMDDAVDSCKDHIELRKGGESFYSQMSQEKNEYNARPAQEKEVATSSSIIEAQGSNSDTLDTKRVNESETSEQMPFPQEETPAAASPPMKGSSPRKGYSDILDVLDDNNFNPFVTKANVMNSPDRVDCPQMIVDEKKIKECQFQASGPKDEMVNQHMSPLDSFKNLYQGHSGKVEEEISESQNVNVAPLECDPHSAPKAVETENINEQVSLENTVVIHPIEVSEYRQTDSPSDKNLDITSLVDKPDFDPFKTKASVANSPDKKTVPLCTSQESDLSTEEVDVMLQKQGNHDVGQPHSHLSNVSKEQKRKEDASFGESLAVPVSQDKPKEISSLSTLIREGDQKSLTQEEEFTNASEFFSNPEMLDALETYGAQGDKHNLVRNSLYVKFDPLVSGRQSLAPYLAQQFLRRDQDDVRRSSGLISFSPSPRKKQKGEQQEQEVPVESFFSTIDNTIMLDTTATTTFDATTLEATNETVIQNPAAAMVCKMVTEAEMNNKIKNMELMMQDEILRKGRIFEEEKKELTKRVEEQSIVLSTNEVEIGTLRSTIQQMTVLMSKMKAAYDVAEKQHQEDLKQQKTEWEAKLSSASEDQHQIQEELNKTEASFFQLVKKFERLREVGESLHQQKEKLIKELDKVSQEKSQSAEKYKTALKTLQESFEKAQEEHVLAKQNHEQEMKRASVLIKHAELKILSLSETEAKKNMEIKRLTSLLEDITGNMGGKVQ